MINKQNIWSWIVLIFAGVVGYFLYKPASNHIVLDIPRGSAPIDEQIYNEVVSEKQYANEEVIKSSLLSFDIDGDGDMDVVGFISAEFDYGISYIFATWHRTSSGLVYYNAGYDNFTIEGEHAKNSPCSIRDVVIGKVTLTCSESGQEYITTLGYQPNGVGYYRDVDAHAVMFDDYPGRLTYESSRGGIRFKYPTDVEITEQTYTVYDEEITLITAARDNQKLFDIKIQPQAYDLGGSVISLSSKTVFVKLADGTYLSREWMHENRDASEFGIFYLLTKVHEENNAGSFGDIVEYSNIRNGLGYVIFPYATSENDAKEVDNIISSLEYVQIPPSVITQNITMLQNKIMFEDVATLDVPGRAIYVESSNLPEGVLDEAYVVVHFIESDIYKPDSLELQLFPFGSVGGVDFMGGGGYDASKKGCYDYLNNTQQIVTPKMLGLYQVCEFGYGDAGFSRHGYYIIDPSQKYILSIAHSSDGFTPRETLFVDLEKIVQSVRFTIPNE